MIKKNLLVFEINDFIHFPYLVHIFDFSVNDGNYQLEVTERDINIYKCKSIQHIKS